MEYGWFIIIISVCIVGMVGYFLWRQFFMSPADASEVGAAGSTPGFWHRRPRESAGTHDGGGRAQSYRVEDERHRGSEEPNPPLT